MLYYESIPARSFQKSSLKIAVAGFDETPGQIVIEGLHSSTSQISRYLMHRDAAVGQQILFTMKLNCGLLTGSVSHSADAGGTGLMAMPAILWFLERMSRSVFNQSSHG